MRTRFIGAIILYNKIKKLVIEDSRVRLLGNLRSCTPPAFSLGTFYGGQVKILINIEFLESFKKRISTTKSKASIVLALASLFIGLTPAYMQGKK